MNAREIVEPVPDGHRALLLLEPLHELARAFGDERLVFADRGRAHAAVPVLAPPEVRLRILDRDHGKIPVVEHAPNEVCDEYIGNRCETEVGERRRVNVRGPLGRPEVPRRALRQVLSRMDTSFGPRRTQKWSKYDQKD